MFFSRQIDSEREILPREGGPPCGAGIFKTPRLNSEPKILISSARPRGTHCIPSHKAQEEHEDEKKGLRAGHGPWKLLMPLAAYNTQQRREGWKKTVNTLS